MQNGFFSRRKALATGIAGIGALGLPRWSLAQGKYPDKTIRVIVPFPAGGTTDVVARMVLQKMGVQMNASFVIDNKGGANGIIGSEQVSRAAPDGYTLLFNTSGAQTLSPVLYKTNYQALASFEPVGMACELGFVLIARKDLPANNVQELIALAKKSSKPLTASSGSSLIVLITEQFKRTIDQPHIINVQYKGTSPQMQAVVTGEVDFSFDSFVSVEMLKAGKVKALGMVLPKRTETFPNVPTLKEQGVEGMEFATWAGMLAPKDTPKAIVDVLAANLEKAVQDPGIIAKLRANEFMPHYMPPGEFGQRVQSDYDRWKRIVKETNFKLE